MSIKDQKYAMLFVHRVSGTKHEIGFYYKSFVISLRTVFVQNKDTFWHVAKGQGFIIVFGYILDKLNVMH